MQESKLDFGLYGAEGGVCSGALCLSAVGIGDTPDSPALRACLGFPRVVQRAFQSAGFFPLQFHSDFVKRYMIIVSNTVRPKELTMCL